MKRAVLEHRCQDLVWKKHCDLDVPWLEGSGARQFEPREIDLNLVSEFRAQTRVEEEAFATTACASTSQRCLPDATPG